MSAIPFFRLDQIQTVSNTLDKVAIIGGHYR